MTDRAREEEQCREAFEALLVEAFADLVGQNITPGMIEKTCQRVEAKLIILPQLLEQEQDP